jgi:hypothetical protein
LVPNWKSNSNYFFKNSRLRSKNWWRRRDDDARGQALLGVRAHSQLPEFAGDAVLEYSVAVPDGGDAVAAADAENRLVRLQVGSRWNDLDYSLNLFSVGDDYARAAATRDHLRSLGLTGAGSGAELSAAWAVQAVELRPRVRRVVRDDGAAQRVEEAGSLQVSRALWDALDVAATFETLRDAPRDGATGGSLEALEANRAHLRVAGSGWQLSWRGASSDRTASGAALVEAIESTEVGLRLDGPGSLRFVPRYRADTRRAGAVERQILSGSLGVSASLPLLQSLQLELEYQQRQEPGAEASGIGAVVKVRQPLSLSERLPQGFLMDASLSWRQSEALGLPLWDDGLAFSLSLEYRRNGLH